jgi:hypothetical protein
MRAIGNLVECTFRGQVRHKATDGRGPEAVQRRDDVTAIHFRIVPSSHEIGKGANRARPNLAERLLDTRWTSAILLCRRFGRPLDGQNHDRAGNTQESATSGHFQPPGGFAELMVKEIEQTASTAQINVVLNWFEELKRRVLASK